MPNPPYSVSPYSLGDPGHRPAVEAARAWQGHVDAGRIGSGHPLSSDQLRHLLHNEEVLLGRAVSRGAGR